LKKNKPQIIEVLHTITSKIDNQQIEFDQGEATMSMLEFSKKKNQTR